MEIRGRQALQAVVRDITERKQAEAELRQYREHEYQVRQIERELEFARQIQMSLLPLEAPDVPGLDMSGFSQPARHAGGDFFNYFVFGPDHVGIAAGDVSGKGIHAALMMALSVGMLTNQVRRDITPGALLAELNAHIRPHTLRNKLNTALCYVAARIEASGWVIRVANAGFVAPLARRSDGQVEWLDTGGLPLGTQADATYAELEYALAPGAVLVLSSDGISEAKDSSGALYGFHRLEHCLARAPRGSAREIQDWILADVRAFVGDAEPHDDLTLVVVAVKDSER
jgi:sigma-B regulation protein RsbU (phosphoserine phosphatase)